MSYEYSVTDEEIPHSSISETMRKYSRYVSKEVKNIIFPSTIARQYEYERNKHLLSKSIDERCKILDVWRIYKTKGAFYRDGERSDLYCDKLLYYTYYIEDKEERRNEQMKILANIYDEVKDEFPDDCEIYELSEPFNASDAQIAITCRISEMLNDKDMTEDDFASEMRKIYRLNKHNFTYICTIRDNEEYD